MLAEQALRALAPNATALVGTLSESPIDLNFHITKEGDVLASTSVSNGLTGETVLRGTLFGLPYELLIKVKLVGKQVEVTLHLTKPIEVGPFTLKFDLGGVRMDGDRIIGASSVVPSSDVQALGLSFWCVLRCGGAAILGTLVKCLPSLVGGPAAYVACVTASIGTGTAAAIAICVATKCVK